MNNHVEPDREQETILAEETIVENDISPIPPSSKVQLSRVKKKGIQSHTLNSNDSNSSFHELEIVGSRICQVIIPVVLCALYVVVLVKTLEQHVYKSTGGILDFAWHKLGVQDRNTNESETFSKALIGNIIIVGVFLALIAIVTIVVLFVFYMEWHACLSYYFYLPSLIIMTILTPYYLSEILMSTNWFGLDLISLVVFTWNFTALGLIAIFGVYTYAPLYLQQFYLIHNSAILAVLILNALPGWAPWLLLVFLVFWDLFAVLAPIGPLNLLINMAEKEGVVDMPGLIYTTDVRPSSSLDRDSKPATSRNQKKSDQDSDDDDDSSGAKSSATISSDASVPSAILPALTVASDQPVDSATEQDSNIIKNSKQTATSNNKKIQQQPGQNGLKGSRKKSKTETRSSIEERGVNIGLGDFIFYSLFIGLTVRKQDLNDYNPALASLKAIIIGLILTLIILALTRRALPALPISIGLGLIIAPMTIYFGSPLANELAREQVFV